MYRKIVLSFLLLFLSSMAEGEPGDYYELFQIPHANTFPSEEAFLGALKSEFERQESAHLRIGQDPPALDMVQFLKEGYSILSHRDSREAYDLRAGGEDERKLFQQIMVTHTLRCDLVLFERMLETISQAALPTGALLPFLRTVEKIGGKPPKWRQAISNDAVNRLVLKNATDTLKLHPNSKVLIQVWDALSRLPSYPPYEKSIDILKTECLKRVRDAANAVRDGGSETSQAKDFRGAFFRRAFSLHAGHAINEQEMTDWLEGYAHLGYDSNDLLKDTVKDLKGLPMSHEAETFVDTVFNSRSNIIAEMAAMMPTEAAARGLGEVLSEPSLREMLRERNISLVMNRHPDLHKYAKYSGTWGNLLHRLKRIDDCDYWLGMAADAYLKRLSEP